MTAPKIGAQERLLAADLGKGKIDGADIVGRLRLSAASTEVDEMFAAYGKLLDEAADEIERLRQGAMAFLEYEKALEAGNDAAAMVHYDTASKLFRAALPKGK